MKKNFVFLLPLCCAITNFVPGLFAPSDDEKDAQTVAARAPRKPVKQAETSTTLATTWSIQQVEGFPEINFNVALTEGEQQDIMKIWQDIREKHPKGQALEERYYQGTRSSLKTLFHEYANIQKVNDRKFAKDTLQRFVKLYQKLSFILPLTKTETAKNVAGVKVTLRHNLPPIRKHQMLVLQKLAHQTVLHAQDKNVISKESSCGFLPNFVLNKHVYRTFYHTELHGGYTISTLEEPVNGLANISDYYRSGTKHAATPEDFVPSFIFRHKNAEAPQPELIKDKGLLLTLKTNKGGATSHRIQINTYTGAVEEPFFVTKQLSASVCLNMLALQDTLLGNCLLRLAQEEVSPYKSAPARLFLPFQYYNVEDEAFARLCWVETLVEEAHGDNPVAAATAREHLHALTESAGCTTAEELVTAVKEEAKKFVAQDLESERLAAEKKAQEAAKAAQEKARKTEEALSLRGKKAKKARIKAQKRAAAAAKRAAEEARRRAENENTDAAPKATAATAKSSILPQKLQQKFDEVRAQKRVKFRHLKRLFKHVVQTCAPQQLSVTRSGSHTTLHLPGAESFTIAKPHGKQDLSIPAQRVADDLENLAHTLLADLQAQTQDT